MWTRVCTQGAVMRRGSRLFSTKASIPHLTLFTGTHCSLCDDMKEVLEAETTPFTLAMYNIRDDTSPNVEYWRRKYQYDIPVLHLRWGEPTQEDDYGPGTLNDGCLPPRP